jgi:ferredoxin
MIVSLRGAQSIWRAIRYAFSRRKVIEGNPPHASNVAGDFYVEDGCCTSCGMPFTVAPDLFESHPDGHCYVSKQPTIPAEVHRMVQAFAVQDVGCIRYKGRNRVIMIRLIGTGEGDQIDHIDADLDLLNREVKVDRWGLK